MGAHKKLRSQTIKREKIYLTRHLSMAPVLLRLAGILMPWQRVIIFQACRAAREFQLEEAISLVRDRFNPDGSLKLQNNAGKKYFEMEQVSEPSKWNTLRALCVREWWDAS